MKEAAEAADYFSNIRNSLGEEFSIELDASIKAILEAPERWPVIEADLHRYLTHTFSYAIVYAIEIDFVHLIAVMHTSREPGYWRSRL